MDNAKQIKQRKAAKLAIALLQVVRQHNWSDVDVVSDAATAIQDNFLKGCTDSIRFELKQGEVLTLHFDERSASTVQSTNYYATQPGFSLQIAYDEDRIVSLGNCAANSAWISKRGHVTKTIDLDKANESDEMSNRMASYLNEE